MVIVYYGLLSVTACYCSLLFNHFEIVSQSVAVVCFWVTLGHSQLLYLIYNNWITLCHSLLLYFTIRLLCVTVCCCILLLCYFVSQSVAAVYNLITLCHSLLL